MAKAVKKGSSRRKISKKDDGVWSVVQNLLGDKYGEIEVINFEDSVRYTDFIPTGLPMIDDILSLGKGLPRGSFVEFSGPESGGKSTLALRIAAAAQRLYPDDAVVYCDLERSLVEDRARQLGVNTSKDKFVIPQSNYDAENFFNFLKDLMESASGKISLIVIDSVSALIPKEFYEKEEEKRTTLLAALFAKKLNVLKTAASKSNTCIIWINQLREKQQQVVFYPGQDMTYTPGGRALKHYLDIRFGVSPLAKSKGGWIEKNIGGKDVKVGYNAKVVCLKNKTGSPMAEDSFPIYYVSLHLEDRLFWVGRKIEQEGGSSKIISVRNDIFKFQDHEVEGEDAFKTAMISEGFFMDLYDEISKVCNADGISRIEAEEYFKARKKELASDVKEEEVPEEDLVESAG